jgi:N-formylglutamate deformylase
VRAIHGVAMLYDCHSIRSQIPFLFDGTLPDFNIGTNNGETCAPVIEAAVAGICAARKAIPACSTAASRAAGPPATTGGPRKHARHPDGTGAVQYISTEEPALDYDEAKAERLRVHLKTILESC